MVYYANSFSCATTDAKDEFIINFQQKGPAYDEDGKINGTITESIANIVLNRAGVDALLGLLSSFSE